MQARYAKSRSLLIKKDPARVLKFLLPTHNNWAVFMGNLEMTGSSSPTKTDQGWEKESGSLPPPDDLVDSLESSDPGQPMPVNSKVLRKVDLHIVPLIALLYLCSFLYVLYF